MKDLPVPTAAELKRSFAARGVRPSRGRGQNFLVDPEAMRFIVRSARLGPRDVVLEPGAGTGGLTALLAARAAAVVAVEVDRKLHAMAAERLADLPNVVLVHGDIMGRGDTLALEVRDALRAALAGSPSARFKVVANLPYRISTALIAVLLTGGAQPSEMVVTVQEEVADRISAEPGTSDYGYLSVLVQAVATVERLRQLGRSRFWPKPEVESRVLRITPDPKRRPTDDDLDALRRVAGALFGHRRKQAAGALAKAGLSDSRQEAQRLLSEIGASATARPEELTVEQFLILARHLAKGDGSA